MYPTCTIIVEVSMRWIFQVPVHQERELVVAVERPNILAWECLTAATDQNTGGEGIGP